MCIYLFIHSTCVLVHCPSASSIRIKLYGVLTIAENRHTNVDTKYKLPHTCENGPRKLPASKMKDKHRKMKTDKC